MYQKYTFYKSIVKLLSAKIFNNVKASNINFDKKEKVLDERNFEKNLCHSEAEL